MKFLPLTAFILYCFYTTSVTAKNESTDPTPEKSDVETRWGPFDLFDQIDQNTCVTGYDESGICVNLRRCPQLLSQVRHLNPGRIFENLHEYTAPCPFRGQVCCPERRQSQAQWEPEPLRTSTERWSWTSSEPRTPRPVPQTSASWTTQRITTKTTKKPKNKVPSSKTKHKNRKLLPENECGVSLANRIIGGKETGLEEHPWLAFVRIRLPSGQTAFACGGSIISARFVLTAGHCIKGSGIPRGAITDLVRVGEHNTMTGVDCSHGNCNSAHQDIPVEQQIVHPDFTPNDPGTFNDIALLRLKYDAVFTRNVIPICLPLDGLLNRQYDGTKLTTVGWGRTSNSNARNSQIKMAVDVPVVPNSRCAPVYLTRNIQIRDTQMCAGGVKDQDSCQGDSGGPLLSLDSVGGEQRWVVQGIVSTGPKECGKQDTPAIYTRVNKYVTWILENIAE